MPSPQTTLRPDATALSLFGDEVSSEAGQSKIRRNLAKLMLDIAEARQRIIRDETLVQSLIDRLEKEIRPFEKQFLEARIETLRLLGGSLSKPWLKKRDAKLLREALCGLADELEEDFGVDLETERTTLLGQEFMSEAEEREFDAVQDLFQAQLEAFLKERHGAGKGSSSSGSREDEGFHHERGGGPRHRRKPGAGTDAKAAGKGKEEEALAGDIRALYLLLARALHPDKEADEDRKREKTAWMQKVAAAYGERKLADLLDIMARNPMDSVGPYLSQAPLKTVQGFAKRLRRELTLLRRQADDIRLAMPPEFRKLLGPEGVNANAFKAHVAGARKQVKLVKARLESYRHREAIEELVMLLRKYDWEGLI